MIKMQKIIVVTGGVLSGLGKGITAASIGHLISKQVTPIKLDGYLNTDPGTMNPLEHGEVFVLDDGSEVDMDFGHYERFLNTTCTGAQSVTMGKVFEEIRKKERRGDYLGKTVQYVPHVVDLIKEKILSIKSEIILIEVGGTVGDLENNLYIEAIRQLRQDVGKENILYVHLTYVPIPVGVNEQKSKPTQQSVNELRSKGIQPDIIIARCSEYLTPKIVHKIANFCDVSPQHVITAIDVDNVYKIPYVFQEQGLLTVLNQSLKLYLQPQTAWTQLLTNLDNPQQEIVVAIYGKYTDLGDSYASINEALMHCAAHLNTKINLQLIDTTTFNGNITANAVIIPGGFGSRGTEGKIEVIKQCRKQGTPILGICLGMQLMVVEHARSLGLNANSSEIDPNIEHPVIDIMPEQKSVTDKGATMRLGAYTAILKEGIISSLYNSTTVSERHRHRYEVNPQYHNQLEQEGLILCGKSEDGRLIEFIERNDHPYFVGTQAHPELKSTFTKPAPLFMGLVDAALKIRSNPENAN